MTMPAFPAAGSYGWRESWAQPLHNYVAGLKALNVRTVTSNTILVLTDDYVRTDSASAITVTVPPNSSVAFPIGAVVQVRRHGAGIASLLAGTGVTLNGAIAGAPRYGSYALIQVAVDTWDVEGGI